MAGGIFEKLFEENQINALDNLLSVLLGSSGVSNMMKSINWLAKMKILLNATNNTDDSLVTILTSELLIDKLLLKFLFTET